MIPVLIILSCLGGALDATGHCTSKYRTDVWQLEAAPQSVEECTLTAATMLKQDPIPDGYIIGFIVCGRATDYRGKGA